MRHGVASTAFDVALILWGLGELYWLRRNRGHAPVSSDPTYYVMAAGMTAGIVSALAVAGHVQRATISDGRTWPVVVGFAVLVAGIALRVWSIQTLGRYFTYVVSVQAGQRVIEDGPYRLLRHPSYTGLLLAFGGTGLLLDNWLALALIVLIPLAAVLARIRAEEATLGRELGDVYRAYAARTDRLVPRVW
jgi:protein-S-isoprenylcysteine O-methyltransferase Ste14